MHFSKVHKCTHARECVNSRWSQIWKNRKTWKYQGYSVNLEIVISCINQRNSNKTWKFLATNVNFYYDCDDLEEKKNLSSSDQYISEISLDSNFIRLRAQTHKFYLYKNWKKEKNLIIWEIRMWHKFFTVF